MSDLPEQTRSQVHETEHKVSLCQRRRDSPPPFLDGTANLNATIKEPEGNEGPKAKEMVQHRTLVVDDFVVVPHGDAIQNPTSSP
nr:hypothetical protein CFP56_41602 [Quercus suber]